MSAPLQIFIAYSRKDTSFLDELRTHFTPLERSGKVKIWYDGKIEPGKVWEAAIKDNLHSADIILLLVSADAIASNYFYDKEVPDALQRHENGEARVVPLIVRPCDWQETPLHQLQAIPKNGKAVSTWPDRDEAYVDAISSLKTILDGLRMQRAAAAEQAERERNQSAEEARRQQAAAAAAAQEAERRKKEQEQQAEKQRQLEEQRKRDAEATAALEAERRKKEQEQQAEKQRQFEEQRKRDAEATAALEAERRKKEQEQQAEKQRQLEEQNKRDSEAAELRCQQEAADLLNKAEKESQLKSVGTPPKRQYTAAMSSTLRTLKVLRSWLFGLGALLVGNWLCKPTQFEPIASDNVIEEPTQPMMSNFIDPFENDMVLIEGGAFKMGNNKSVDEKPQHEVTVETFYLFRYEVSQAQWRAVMGKDTPSGYFNGCDGCPVESVSWKDVQIFLKKLNLLTGKDYRLPSEAEWEYAARGGNQSSGFKFAGSNNLKEVGWYFANSDGKTHLVGKKKKNELGLYDMSGNVWEWCQDIWHESYNGAPNNGSAWASGGNNALRVVRGGCYNGSTNGCRSVNRIRNFAADWNNNIGFRLAR